VVEDLPLIVTCVVCYDVWTSCKEITCIILVRIFYGLGNHLYNIRKDILRAMDHNKVFID